MRDDFLVLIFPPAFCASSKSGSDSCAERSSIYLSVPIWTTCVFWLVSSFRRPRASTFFFGLVVWPIFFSLLRVVAIIRPCSWFPSIFFNVFSNYPDYSFQTFSYVQKFSKQFFSFVYPIFWFLHFQYEYNHQLIKTFSSHCHLITIKRSYVASIWRYIHSSWLPFEPNVNFVLSLQVFVSIICLSIDYILQASS